jgi:hypothetical protein
MALYSVAGLTQQIELPVPLIQDLLPIRPNVRSGIPRNRPGYWVQHETGNPRVGANAQMHSRYLHNNIPDGTFVSFHFAVDDGVIYQMVPVNEVTWQAADGGGPGNYSGISSELCINQGIDVAKSRHNAEALAGGVMRALGMSGDRCKRHWDFNYQNTASERHHCPDNMMTDGYWPTFVANVSRIITPPAPTYAVPVGLPWRLGVDVGWMDLNGLDFYAGRWGATARRKLIPRAYASDNAPESAPDIPKDARVTVVADGKGKDGVGWAIREDGSRLRSSGLLYDITIKKKV